MKRIAVLGSTGSIGRQTLEVVAAHPDEFSVSALTAHDNVGLLAEQINSFRPRYFHADRPLPTGTAAELLPSLTAAAALDEVDVVVLAVSGFAALPPLMAALEAGKCVAIANKESIVAGGELVRAALTRHGGELVPIDSEQSAIFQCLQGSKRAELARVILTCSGGPFWAESREQLKTVPIERVFRHPTWSMGRKITLDSATLFNKGLEVIEAARLFELEGDSIQVLIHPQSVVHSMVEFIDGSVIANLALPDMRIPIQYALSYPERIATSYPKLKLYEQPPLQFFKPDFDRFTALRLAYSALEAGGGCPVVYNGANEQAATLYLEGRIGFWDIERSVEHALEHYQNRPMDSMEAVYESDRISRESVKTLWRV